MLLDKSSSVLASAQIKGIVGCRTCPKPLLKIPLWNSGLHYKSHAGQNIIGRTGKPSD